MEGSFSPEKDSVFRAGSLAFAFPELQNYLKIASFR
jgi:hypothetical protein